MNALARLIPGFKPAVTPMAEVIDAALAARRRLAAEIVLLQSSNSARQTELQRIATAATARRNAAALELQTAKEAELAAIQEASTFSIALNAGISRLETELIRTAPAAIEQAVEQWRAAWERARVISIASRRQRAEATEAEVADTEARAAAERHISARCSGLLGAMQQAQALKLQTFSAVELAERLAAINDSIPAMHP
jgi:hypothetical protein